MLKRGVFHYQAGTVQKPEVAAVRGLIDETRLVGYCTKKLGGKTWTAAYDLTTGLLIIIQLGRGGCDAYINRHWDSIMHIRQNPYYAGYKAQWHELMRAYRKEGGA